MKTSNRRKLAALVLPFALLVAACGSDSDGASSSNDEVTATTVAPDAGGSDTTAAPAGGSDEGPAGPACSAVPTDGEGSVSGMADDPVATAASNNPLLSTLVTAVGEAGLVDTLNGLEAATVFAPTNDAFAEIPEADLAAVLADKELLTSILTLHVLPERVEMGDLSGSYATVNGQEITVEGDAPEFDVNGQASAVCSGVQTANATVYLIDSVLMPS